MPPSYVMIQPGFPAMAWGQVRHDGQRKSFTVNCLSIDPCLVITTVLGFAIAGLLKIGVLFITGIH